jgi:DNA-binding winged helix-turn-helix (wHTH) protein
MIEQIPTHLGKIRFGAFEVDLRSGELRKGGIRIKLQSQPFKLFAILLNHAGEIVTREELQQQIWGSETVVNFDHSLGTAVNKVREALGDSAENPRYIETLAKRGYRFIATLEALDSPETSANSQPVLSPEAVSPPRTEAQAAKQTPSSAPAIPRRIAGLAIVVVAVIAVVAALRLWWPFE